MAANRIPGKATLEGTARYRARFSDRAAPDHFIEKGGLWLSSVGIGTYLGEPNAADDIAYREALLAAVRGGCNVIDSAINYRFQRSERNIGAAIRTLVEAGDLSRDEIVVATKGGFIPFDTDFPTDPAGWFRSALLEPGIAAPEDVVANCHIMTPRYLEAQLDWSRRNLGLDSIDIYYLHNPETQLQEVRRDEFLVRVTSAFELLERKVQDGVVGMYGLATWDGFRVGSDSPGHLSLAEILRAAERAGGKEHHFRAIQLPVNLVMTEACLEPTQLVAGRWVPLLEAARGAGMVVMSSGSLLQGKVIGSLGPAFADLLPETRTDAQRGLQIVRSATGLTTALVGMKRTGHVEENLELARIPRLSGDRARQVMQACRHR